ncbi:hypothetical protein [Paenibacillus planticolens]|uniref:Uncharacterized protein n=1 Tax=Paenibacillus planticolens TaxID=2654976 RepID=A0ABX1ZEA7_9BACL|nr:hypothetical protein [Paenibacillus planticolens]NOU98440.1 hypothetical protein [Paenibacillus planticolens]
MGEKIGAVAACILVILAFCGVVSLIALGIVGVVNIAGFTIPFGAAALIAFVLIVISVITLAKEDDANERK